MLRLHPLDGGEASLTFSSVECLGGFLRIVVLWILDLRACRVSGLRAWVSCSFGASCVYCLCT
jgi:hypothetical protein